MRDILQLVLLAYIPFAVVAWPDVAALQQDYKARTANIVSCLNGVGFVYKGVMVMCQATEVSGRPAKLD